ncbi:hypothetical protein PRIPAC_72042 [Pristionchus pacificus]|uniref:Ribosome assembly factor mrt4 n=1 Tax=Pristionchus pacificus TaxID=54126 RepID=A0A454XQY2_PRIPA|nr:hypothetical protein PRIPAC_72042 [Pristionchus pacificus]|eukprot:PDM61108.1 ribosomal protein [Pristionchus pacificus]
MPRSKRDKDVSLTRVKKKTRGAKEGLVHQLREAVDEYPHVFVYEFENMRSSKFVQVRQKFKSNSRFYFGKNNVMAIALGKDKTTECATGISKISQLLKGQCGLMFTSADKDEVIQYFRELKDADFARAGVIAPQTIDLSAGPLEQFAFSVEPQLRKLGMPTSLVKGVIHLTQDFRVCTEGEAIKPEEAKILKFLEEKLSVFQVNLKAYWSKQTGLKDLA